MLKVVKRNPRSPNLSDSPVILFIPCQKKVQPIRNLETRSISLKNPGGACGLHIFPPKLERTAAGTFCSPKFFRSNFVTILQNPSFLIILPFGFLRSQFKRNMKRNQTDYNGQRIFQPRLTKPKQCCENRDGYTAALRIRNIRQLT